MKNALAWIWRRGVLSTFITGLLAILPLLLTVVILAWVVGYLRGLFGPEGLLGKPLTVIGLRVVSGELAAWTLGVLVVLVGIWCLGLFLKTFARQRVIDAANALIGRIPIVKNIYGIMSQLVGMLKKDQQSDLSNMTAVFYRFSGEHSGGLLGLLASGETFEFGGKQHYLLFVPTSPLPMSGALIFVPVENVEILKTTVDQVMQIYLSMGMLSKDAFPKTPRNDG